MTPQEMVADMNAREAVRCCANCKSRRLQYQIRNDSICCMDCGASDNLEWALKSDYRLNIGKSLVAR